MESEQENGKQQEFFKPAEFVTQQLPLTLTSIKLLTELNIEAGILILATPTPVPVCFI